MKAQRAVYLLALSTILSAGAAQADVTVTPVANVSLLGGQYWVSNAMPDSFGGNADVFFSPVINFSAASALLPLYTGIYSGTKDVRELVGGGTMTRELQDHALTLKYVRKLPGGWKLKPRIGYKIEYLKETKDETWGKGLFDYQKMLAGLEGEKAFGPRNFRAGMEYYTMHYPNYQALINAEAFQTSLDTTTYTEISSQAGKDVLDYAATALFAEMRQQLSPRAGFRVQYDVSLKNFNDQKTVRRTGEFSGSVRSDIVHAVGLGLTLATPRAVIGVSDGVQYYDSNQNSFDAANAQFTADYYDFVENTIVPSLAVNLGSLKRPVRLSLLWELSSRAYRERLAQNADGTYKNERVTQAVNTVSCGLSYPFSDLLAARFSASYRDASSNMRYEKNYTYNYYTVNYYMGVQITY